MLGKFFNRPIRVHADPNEAEGEDEIWVCGFDYKFWAPKISLDSLDRCIDFLSSCSRMNFSSKLYCLQSEDKLFNWIKSGILKVVWIS